METMRSKDGKGTNVWYESPRPKTYVPGNGKLFEVDPDHHIVREVGTNLYYDAYTLTGYQLDADGRRIGLTSYAAFGEVTHQAREGARHWCEEAQEAWEKAS